jgi:hypothetical protein
MRTTGINLTLLAVARVLSFIAIMIGAISIEPGPEGGSLSGIREYCIAHRQLYVPLLQHQFLGGEHCPFQWMF